MSLFHILSVWRLTVTQGHSHTLSVSGVATDLESLSSLALRHPSVRSRCSSSWSLAGFASEITEYCGARTDSLWSTGSAWSKSDCAPLMEGQTTQSTDWSLRSSGGHVISPLFPHWLCFKNLPLDFLFREKSQVPPYGSICICSPVVNRDGFC